MVWCGAIVTVVFLLCINVHNILLSCGSRLTPARMMDIRNYRSLLVAVDSYNVKEIRDLRRNASVRSIFKKWRQPFVSLHCHLPETRETVHGFD